jgi:hypothetical protein
VLDVLLDVLLDAFIGSGTSGLNVSQPPTGSLRSFCSATADALRKARG